MLIVQIEVKEDLARRRDLLSDQGKDDLVRIFDVWTHDRHALSAVMDDMSEYALRKDLTPKVLEELLKKR